MQSGDPVTVTNLDGETAEGVIDEVTAWTAHEYEADWMDVDGATLLDYWRGKDVDPEEPVVNVDLDGSVYPYPASRVEVRAE